MSDRICYKNQDYYKIRKNCLENRQLFYDDFFEFNVPGAMWLRPGKITKTPRFIVEGASRFDVVQGATLNCWLLVAMANLTMDKTLFQHVVPINQSFVENYIGMFLFRIWQCGDWVEVVVDDRLPTKDGNLIYVRSRQQNEFWSALLEKAYAKLYGSYSELTSGWFCEGMVDFTGGIVERLKLSTTYQPTNNLGDILAKPLEKSSFMCVFTPDNPVIREQVTTEGLIKGHAYSITKVKKLHLGSNETTILVRLRNPWGEIEWNGAWSDSSKEWRNIPTEEKKKMGLVSETDGEFWMSISDFSKHFDYVDICHLSPDQYVRNEGGERIGWEENYFKGEWIKGVNAGGFGSDTFHVNPQYRITLTDSDDDKDNLCTVIIALMQKNKTRNIWHAINFTAFLLKEPEKLSKCRLSENYIKTNFQNSMSSKLKRYRENVVHDTWEPGVYCIIPATQYSNEEGQFLLRVYSEKKVVMEESKAFLEEVKGTTTLSQSTLKDVASGKPTGIVQTVTEVKNPYGIKLLHKNDQEIMEYFREVAGNDGEVAWEKLQLVLDFALGNTQMFKKDVSGSSTETDGGILSFFTGIISWLFGDSWRSHNSSKPRTNTKFTKDECRSLIKMLDDDFSGKLGFNEFRVLLKKMRGWELVFLNHSNGTDTMFVSELLKALTSADYNVSTRDIGSLVRRYSDNKQQLTFDDFIMCAIELETKV